MSNLTAEQWVFALVVIQGLLFMGLAVYLVRYVRKHAVMGFTGPAGRDGIQGPPGPKGDTPSDEQIRRAVFGHQYTGGPVPWTSTRTEREPERKEKEES